MSRAMRFWRNVILIGLAHAAALVGIARWGGTSSPPVRPDLVWMAAPLGGPSAALPQLSPPPAETPPPPVEEAEVRLEKKEDAPAPPAMIPAQSEIPLPTPTRAPSPTPSATAKPKPSATPKTKPTPQPSRSSAKKPKPTPSATPKKNASAKPATSPPTKPVATANKAATVAVSPAQENAGGSEVDGRGTGSAAEFNRYGNMLHDRFFGAWIQPMTASATGGKMSAVVQLRIEKDGRVSNFTIVRSSGNVVVDESVVAVGQRVLKVEALPAALAAGGHYDVRIKFELDVE